MNKEFRNKVLFTAILFCGVPTGIINGLIAYFTAHAMTFGAAGLDLAITMSAVAFITTLIVYPLGKKTASKLPDIGQPGIYAKLPQGTLALSVAITLIITVVFVAIPFALMSLLPSPSAIEALPYSIFKGIYSVPVAASTNFIANAVAKISYSTACN